MAKTVGAADRHPRPESGPEKKGTHWVRCQQAQSTTPSWPQQQRSPRAARKKFTSAASPTLRGGRGREKKISDPNGHSAPILAGSRDQSVRAAHGRKEWVTHFECTEWTILAVGDTRYVPCLLPVSGSYVYWNTEAAQWAPAACPIGLIYEIFSDVAWPAPPLEYPTRPVPLTNNVLINKPHANI